MHLSLSLSISLSLDTCLCPGSARTLTHTHISKTTAIPRILVLAFGHLVWNDLNGNGQQEWPEPGIAGVTIKLKTCTNTLVATTITDTLGQYGFRSVIPGCYIVVFSIPMGMYATLANTGSDYTDSDIDASGETGQYTLPEGVQFTSVDAGFVGDPSGHTIERKRREKK